jgi:hypothetical protein
MVYGIEMCNNYQGCRIPPHSTILRRGYVR